MPRKLYWLTATDRQLLKWVDEYDIVFTPMILQKNLERDNPELAPSYSQVSRRVRTLETAGLLEQWDEKRGRYVITELGRDVANDDLDDDDLEHLASINPKSEK